MESETVEREDTLAVLPVEPKRGQMHPACVAKGHALEPVSDPYYKVTGELRIRRLPFLGIKKDKSVKYLMLCCSQCGITKEIIHLDRRYSLDQVKSL